MLLTSSDTKRSNNDASILVYKFRPERTGFNMYAEYTQPQLTFLALVPWNKTHRLSRNICNVICVEFRQYACVHSKFTAFYAAF